MLSDVSEFAMFFAAVAIFLGAMELCFLLGKRHARQIAMGFIGYGSGLSGVRRHGATAVFAVMIAMVFTTILDLDRPRRGFIRVDEESMLRLERLLDQEEATLSNPGDLR